MLNRRLQILIDKDMWHKLARRSKAQNLSIGEYIRRAVIKSMEKDESTGKPQTPFNRLFNRQQRG